jgi:hypothetical protein
MHFDGVEQPDNLAALDLANGTVAKGGQDQSIEEPLAMRCGSQASCFTTVKLLPNSGKGIGPNWPTFSNGALRFGCGRSGARKR